MAAAATGEGKGAVRRWWLLATVLILTGCFDQWQLKERWVALGIGVDRDPTGVRVTMQTPPETAVDVGDGGGGRGTPIVLAAVGPDFEDALSVLAERYSRRLMLGHVRVYVVSAELARQGLGDLVTRLMRDPEVWPEAWLAVAEDRADQVLESLAPRGPVAMGNVWRLLDVGRRTGVVPDATVARFFIDWRTPGTDPVAPVLRVVGEFVQSAGVAVFRGDRLAGVLPPPEDDLLLLLLGRAGGRRLAVPCPEGRPGDVHLRVWDTRSRIGVRPDARGQVAGQVEVALEATVVENACGPAVPGEAVGTFVARYLEGQMAALVRRLQQEFGADVLGFGSRVRGLFPAAFAAAPWEEQYRRLPVAVRVQVRVRHHNLFLGWQPQP